MIHIRFFGHDSLYKRKYLKGLDIEETRETGVVRFHVYKMYWHAVGNFLAVSIFLSLILMQASRNYADVFLAHWVSNQDDITNSSTSNSTVTQYLSIYGGIAAVNALFSFFRAFLFAYGGICAAKTIHQRLLGTVLKAKTWFWKMDSLVLWHCTYFYFLPGRSGNSWSQPSFCRDPPTRGNFCRAFFRRWTYDSTKGRCVFFIYGGCNATRNLFRSKEDCQRTCDKNICN